jgi:hypothetical protein
MSSESIDDELEEQVRALMPVAKERVLHSAKRSPETSGGELWTLASLYVRAANIKRR